MAWYCIQDKKLRLSVRARPSARSTGIREISGTEIVVNVNAPPVENKANKELVRFISKMLRVPKSSIKIVIGTTSMQKTVEVSPWEGSIENLEATAKKMLE
ncbi:hypothetical protein EROM_070290 [Encephalitozoon romaleae SJ-2008]|uniref:Uncharacterized protein n=1 Tax=Encephalitozoon romaleae (strain SJ-2008) TaxID=1178016 RepID=I7AF31_ENCRO|nr:hypothetical protein EROM_070290 [Encephalitozoon romaleae SJ-2008]AFN83280.1 hypothetical protein EROM_070290 [Encephalitozoon romaleae SJ-2008]